MQTGLNRDDGPPRLMVVVAHPDDETFGCGSLLLHAAGAGAVTAVCCATRGEAGQPPADSGLQPDELGAVRERELREAAGLLGVSRVDLLDFVDSGMSGPAGVRTLVGAPFDDVLDSIRERIDDFRPSVVVTLDAGDGHRDHERVRDATLAAVQAARRPVQRVYLHCLSRTLMQRWLDHMQRNDPTWEHLDGPVPGTPDELITTVIDTSRYLAERDRAIAAHASQVSPYAGLPDDLRRAFLASERLQRIVPPWTGGSVEPDVFGD